MPEVPDFLNWYGMPGSKFYELPHIEVKNWKDLIFTNKVSIIKDEND